MAVIAGSTASGKSALALAIAEEVGGVVINTESMQVYSDLRVLTARWLEQPADEGRFFRLDTSTVSVLGFERETPVLLKWNS